MQRPELQELVGALSSKLQGVVTYLQPEKMQKELADLEVHSAATDFWNNQEQAQQTMQRIGYLRERLQTLDSLRQKLEANQFAIEEAEDGDVEILELVESELIEAKRQIERLELVTFLSGKYDAESALLTVNAGTGGTEAMDWAEMLLRMYTRYANSLGWEVVITDKVDGPEAGISTVSVEIIGEYAYGYLKHEHGTHRLVRISPFNAAGQRQTSFAGVDVAPLVSQDIDIQIPESDLEFQAVRSGGAGGQHVNKTSTAVRIRHLPTGILVAYSGQRSQLQNREAAMRILKSKLYLLEQEKMQAEQSKIKGEYKQASWGNQIRNYVLQPYKLVKDTRTEVETSDVEAVLDGDLQLFIDAEIRKL